jgi:hypothetical protein
MLIVNKFLSWLIKHKGMKAYGGVEASLHTVVISAAE